MTSKKDLSTANEDMMTVVGQIADFEACLETERRERLALQGTTGKIEDKVEALISEGRAHHRLKLEELRAAINVAVDTLQGELSERLADVTKSSMKTLEDVQAMEVKCAKFEEMFHERTAPLASVEVELRRLIGDVSSKREVDSLRFSHRLDSFSVSLQKEARKRQAVEERAIRAAIAASNTASQEGRASEVLLEQIVQANNDFSKRLEVEEQQRAEDCIALRAECDQIRESLLTVAENERRACEVNCRDIQTTQAGQYENRLADEHHWCIAQVEDQREWTRLLVERVATELRGEREGAAAELKRQCDNTISIVRSELAAEMRRFNDATVEADHLRTCLDKKNNKWHKQQARSNENQLRDTLIAQQEFAKALEHEQRQLVERLNEGLAREVNWRADLEPRVRSIESDMVKVRGHLPILFTS